MTHDLKCVAPYFQEVWSLRKPFEIRKDDRDYQPGDTVVLREFDGRFYGQRSAVFGIAYVLRDFPGLRKGWCAFGLLMPTEDDDARYEALQAGPAS